MRGPDISKRRNISHVQVLVMGKCKFNENWLHNPNFATWLRPVSGNVFEVRCILCKKVLKLGTMGIKALETHMQCEKHKAAVENTWHFSVLFRRARVSSPTTERCCMPYITICISFKHHGFCVIRHPNNVWLHRNTQS